MPTPRTRPVRGVRREALARLLARVEDLERRTTRLEARLRAGLTVAPAAGGKEAKRGRRRPRCPGCTLELPPGRHGESCVWCGFRFDAVKRLLK